MKGNKQPRASFGDVDTNGDVAGAAEGKLPTLEELYEEAFGAVLEQDRADLVSTLLESLAELVRSPRTSFHEVRR